MPRRILLGLPLCSGSRISCIERDSTLRGLVLCALKVSPSPSSPFGACLALCDRAPGRGRISLYLCDYVPGALRHRWLSR